MKDRIIQFLSENNLTSTKFADEIGVQRSSISHILSGRNKPSFDFIEKMLKAYPELDAQWLITGNGNMYANQPSLFKQDSESKTDQKLSSRESHIQSSNDLAQEKLYSNAEIADHNDKDVSSTEDTIERVIVFYKNGSFKEYKPE